MPITIRNVRCDRQREPSKLLRRGSELGDSSFLAEERLQPDRTLPGLTEVSCRVAAPKPDQGPVPASGPGLEPFPCLPCPLQQGCPKVSERPPGTLAEGSSEVLRGIVTTLPPLALGTQVKT